MLALAVWILLAAGCTPTVRPVDQGPNPVVVENQKPGTGDWQMGRPGFGISGPRGEVEGYADRTSLNHGDSIGFSVSVNPAQTFQADVYRMGWYGGANARLMHHVDSMPGVRQRVCTPDPTTGMVDCAWPTTFRLDVPADWVSGVYLVLLTNAAKFQSYITFVVRDDTRRADLMVQQSVTTYQAYNNYPAGRGKSLYEFNSAGPNTGLTQTTRAVQVSFDRPYATGYGSGQLTGDTYNWERYFIGWVERSGYDVVYSTDLDTHRDGARLLDFKGFLVVGHDEYWSTPMFDAVSRARDHGVGLGFFSANVAYWQVRFEPSASGNPDRVMVCYKDAGLDPVKGPTATIGFRDPGSYRPEQALVGVQYTAHLKNEGKGAQYVVTNADNWVWAGTGFVDGTKVPGILGYETDRLMSEYDRPVAQVYTTLSRSLVVDAVGRKDYSNSSVYQAPGGAWVFASGSNHWSLGLGKPGVEDPRIQRATANILDRFLGRS